MQVTLLRSYRATLVPEGTPTDEVEFRADQRLLPTIQLKSTDAAKAMADAHLVSGKAVLKVERLESAV